MHRKITLNTTCPQHPSEELCPLKLSITFVRISNNVAKTKKLFLLYILQPMANMPKIQGFNKYGENFKAISEILGT